MQWFYDGESWVMASEQPPMKPPKPVEDPVSTAVMENFRGKYNKPKVRSEPDRTVLLLEYCSPCHDKTPMDHEGDHCELLSTASGERPFPHPPPHSIFQVSQVPVLQTVVLVC